MEKLEMSLKVNRNNIENEVVNFVNKMFSKNKETENLLNNYEISIKLYYENNNYFNNIFSCLNNAGIKFILKNNKITYAYILSKWDGNFWADEELDCFQEQFYKKSYENNKPEYEDYIIGYTVLDDVFIYFED